MNRVDRIQGRNIAIVGMARSGVAAAELIKQLGGEPFVSDMSPREKLAEAVARLELAGIAYECGGHTDRLLESDYLIISPGVPDTLDVIRRADSAGLPIFSEIELAYWVCRGTVLAVTGSNGKTTTTALLGEICRASGRPTVVGGNIGTPFSEITRQVGDDGLVVLEVSSFQLERIEQFTPKVGLLLNLTPDHLDRYPTFEDYCAAKYRLFENQDRNHFAVLNADDPVSAEHSFSYLSTILKFSIEPGSAITSSADGVFNHDGHLTGRIGGREIPIIASDQVRIPGPHNLANAAAASAAALAVGIAPEVIASVLTRFGGVEHRLEEVATIGGIRFVNDSKGTNVDAVIVALKSMPGQVNLIAGGRDKAGDFTRLLPAARGKVKNLILVGEAKDKIFRQLGKDIPAVMAATMPDAVRKAYALSRPGDTVLLSPGCASFDMYRNYEERGRDFKSLVRKLANGKGNGAAVQV